MTTKYGSFPVEDPVTQKHHLNPCVLLWMICLVMVISVTALVGCSLALFKVSQLVKNSESPKATVQGFANPPFIPSSTTNTPTVTATPDSPIATMGCTEGSTDTSGSVEGFFYGGGAYQITVHFGTPFHIKPTSVVVSPDVMLPTNNLGAPLAISDINTLGFTVRGFAVTGSTPGRVKLFYYQVR